MRHAIIFLAAICTLSAAAGHQDLKANQDKKLWAAISSSVVHVIQVTTPDALRKTGKHQGTVHALYLRRFNELREAAKEEMEQEPERGGGN